MTELERLVQSNLNTLQAFAQQGIAIGPEILAIIKVEELLDVVFKDDAEGKAEYDLNVEKRKKDLFDSIKQDIREQSIRQKLILPK